MKKVVVSIAVLAVMTFVSCKEEVKKEPVTPEVKTEQVATVDATFGVRGNCGMCKETIETAAKSVAGVSNATWDKAKKKIDITLDDKGLDLMMVHNAIAASGYDTDKVAANEDAYKKLPSCCQYDHTMEMNQSGMHHTDSHDH